MQFFHRVAVHGFQRYRVQQPLRKAFVHGSAGSGFIGKLQGRPDAERVHILPEGFGAGVGQLQLGGVHHRIVEAVVEQHIAQVVHISKRAFHGDIACFQVAYDFSQRIEAEMSEKQQAVGFQRARPVFDHRHGPGGRGDQAEVAPQPVGLRLGQRGFGRLAVLRHGFAFAGKALPKAGLARGGGGLQIVGTAVVFAERGLRITRSQQAAAAIAVGAKQQNMLRRGGNQRQTLVGVFGKAAVDQPAVGSHFSGSLWCVSAFGQPA